MRIGIFDSGLGGLVVAQSISRALPEYDLVYLGDTARVPYGDRSQETIYRFTEAAVRYLFDEHSCHLVIVACNTASAQALRTIQQQFLPAFYPERRVLGVIIPTAEAVTADTRPVGVFATRATVQSQAFVREITRLQPKVEVIQQSAPLLVPLIENGALRHAGPIIEEYLLPLRQAGITQLLLGCTHYGLARPQLEAALPEVRIIAQEDVVPPRLASYLERHPEHHGCLSRSGERRWLVTDLPPHYQQLAEQLTGTPLKLEKISLPL
jgi:glutamate racemase